jgi:hypothetical protein
MHTNATTDRPFFFFFFFFSIRAGTTRPSASHRRL